MKKQINSTINAHLVRGAFYLLLLVAVCAIPFALAQRNTSKRSNVRGVPRLPQRSLAAGLSHAYGITSQVAKPRALHVPVLAPRQPSGACPATITQSTSQSIVDGNSVACSADGGVTTTDNSYWRAFDMNTFTGGQEYDVTSVSFGVEQARSGSGTGQPLTVNLYANHGSPFPGGDWQSNLIATSGEINIPDQADTIFMVPLTATVAAGTLELVMEVMTPDGTDLGNAFFVGSNDLAETGPSYLSSEACGITEPTTTGDLGFPSDHIVFNVNGSCPGGTSPTPTATSTPAACSWGAGPSMPSVGTRMVGVFFPGNGKFYAMGGRSSDTPPSEFTHPFEYDPGSNSWSEKAATYPDTIVNNMACGVLNEGGTDYIYCVGGSELATQITTGRVFRYDPITDTISTVAANWPSGDANILPGGFSVFKNTMVILGGFNVNVSMDDNIWQFDPVALTWTHKDSLLPTQLGYIPQATIGSLIYTGGGSTYDGLLHDSTISLVYDPVADTIGNIATIPRATAETRGLNFCSTMYVMGGGREAPNPSTEVDIYDPVSDSWSVGAPFSEARRNFPTDTNGTDHIWLAGGYGSDGITVLDSMEIFSCAVSPCGGASPTPTATATTTATATATPTSTVRPTPTPRTPPTPRPRPTPAPRP